ncbi:GIY-YIG nuclease family protein [Ruficoccus sp. ZRK36]|uniref:GIY-YIG nuclease family protein n=1 Tax=Ruficoccus sp. ZRK36 TaxID=2866311 RepID=UPI001C72FF89|nr:GIY-YIG nuclease family protein [Ruficoccus sp. ZRK36]QYY34824.1 GIY-YIG nuclease family protein [Ruficoccus sp. ZRK36]
MELPEGIKRVECPEPVEGLSWIYILLMRNGMYYVGQTRDVSRRIQRHADGTGSRQAKQLKEFALVYIEGPVPHDAATKRERQLKKWSHAKKEALIKGDFEAVKRLSKSREN